MDNTPEAPANAFKYWARSEYLAYAVKNTPLPVSLVTGDPSNPTHELVNSDRSLGVLSGFRVGLGTWLDCMNSIGLETTFFSTERGSRTFVASSDAAGNPTLAFPFVNRTPGAVGDFFMPIASPGVFAGEVSVASTLQLWGTETNGVLFLLRRGNFDFVTLAGVRYVNLRETLEINSLSSVLVTDPETTLFQSDRFKTRNQFFGGQIGGRMTWEGHRFAFDLAGKLALGASHETVDIQGFSRQAGPGGINGTFLGGFFTQPSNIGHYTANQFAVIPSVEMKLHLLLTEHIRAFVGYDFMYWSDVVRPGGQLDRNLNLSQSTVFGNGTLIGPAFPVPLLSRTDFWAQGINVGLEFRF